MDEQVIFNFKTDISNTDIPLKLNNPFNTTIPAIAKIAANEFQEFITTESKHWDYNFDNQRGKMFGVLVVQKTDQSICFLGTVSGKFSGSSGCTKFVPSLFDDAVDDYFINKGMTALTAISNQIKNTDTQSEIDSLKEKSKQLSFDLQQKLFKHYNFLNLSGKKKNIVEIFRQSINSKPPSAAGECAAPKLLQYAIEQQLKPIAIAEFWWGNASKNKEKKHKTFYPACKDKCKPILEYMLEDGGLYY